MHLDVDLSRGPKVIRWLRASLAMDVVLIAAGLINLSLYQSGLDGEPVAEDRIAAMDSLNSVLGVGSMGVAVGTAVVFIRWLLQVRRNAVALGAGPLAHSRHAAAWSWFVPVIGLFLPYQVVKEIWQASGPAPEAAVGQRRGVPRVLPAWWGFWVAANLLGQLGFRMSWGLGEASDWADYADVERVALAAAVPSIVAAVLAMRVVRGLDARQRARALRLADPAVPSAPPLPA